MLRRLGALLAFFLVAGPCGMVGLPFVATASLLLRQWRSAWALMVWWVGLALAIILLAGPVGEYVDILPPETAWSFALTMLGYALLVIPSASLTYLMFFNALASPIGQPATESPGRISPFPLWAWFLAPSGVLQLLAGRVALACVYGIAFYVVTLQLLSHLLIREGTAYNADAWEGTPFPQPVGEAWVFLAALAALWLAAIWDAWDTQRKARQAEPAGSSCGRVI